MLKTLAAVIALVLCTPSLAGAEKEELRLVTLATGEVLGPAVAKMTLKEVCDRVGMQCDLYSRQRLVELLASEGVSIFREKYRGTAVQNAQLRLNVIANRALFEGGKLSQERAKRWRVVD